MPKTQDKSLNEFRDQKVSQIHDLLLKSETGLYARTVSDEIGVNDTRLVRDLIRLTLKLAEKEGHKTSREREEKKSTKIYNILAKPREALVKPQESKKTSASTKAIEKAKSSKKL